MARIGGADGCQGGWICIERDTVTGEYVGELLPTTSQLIDRARDLAVLTIDIPIGLTETGPRECDVEARRLLTAKRGSSVFPAPVRAALEGTSYTDACDRSQAACGKRLSKQAHAIMWRIKEVDLALRADPELRRQIREIHPELCFHAWSGGPMEHPKRTPEGKAERLALVNDYFRGAYDALRPTLPWRLVADDDLLDAFAALWTAERISNGTARTVPAAPLEDRFGLRMEMVT
jgi:predicted RNase H-like nuclease